MFFFSQFCDVIQVVITHKYVFAKFDNIQNMKLKIIKHPFIYCKQLWQFLVNVFQKLHQKKIIAIVGNKQFIS